MLLEGLGAAAGGGAERSTNVPSCGCAQAHPTPTAEAGTVFPTQRHRKPETFSFRVQRPVSIADDFPTCPLPLARSSEVDNGENHPALPRSKHFHFHLKQMTQTAFPFPHIVLIFPSRLWKCSLRLKRARSFLLHLCIQVRHAALAR